MLVRTSADDDNSDASLWLWAFVVVAIGAISFQRRHLGYFVIVSLSLHELAFADG
jgi:hypothetical protein